MLSPSSRTAPTAAWPPVRPRPALAELAARTQRLGIDAADIAARAGWVPVFSLSADPARLAQVLQDRRGELARVPGRSAGLQEQLDDVDPPGLGPARRRARLAEIDSPQDNATVLAERLAAADRSWPVLVPS